MCSYMIMSVILKIVTKLIGNDRCVHCKKTPAGESHLVFHQIFFLTVIMKVKKHAISAILLVLCLQSITNADYQIPINGFGLMEVGKKILKLSKAAVELWTTNETDQCPYKQDVGDFLLKEADLSMLELDEELASAISYADGTLRNMGTDHERIIISDKQNLDKVLDSLRIVNFKFGEFLHQIRNDESDEVLPSDMSEPSPVLTCKKMQNLDQYCIKKNLANFRGTLLSDERAMEKQLRHWLHDLTVEIYTRKKYIGYTPADYLHGLYIYIIVTELRAYLLQSYAFYTQVKYMKQNPSCHAPEQMGCDPTFQLQILYKILERRLDASTTSFANVLPTARTDFVALRPQYEQPDVTYVELEGAIEPFYVRTNDKSLSFPKRTENRTASLQCTDIPRQMKFPEYTNVIFPRPCAGKILNCIPALPETRYQVCYSTLSSKRYVWTRPKKSGNQRRPCKGKLQILEPSDDKDELCICECVDNSVHSPTTHIVNLQLVEADFGMVVTGVRFIIQHGILNIQIQQGKISKHFLVQEAKWKPINDIADGIRAARLNKTIPGNPPGVVKNRDYTIIGQYAMEFFLKDDITDSTDGWVITGVKFSLATIKSIRIEVLRRKYNPMRGELDFRCTSRSFPDTFGESFPVRYSTFNDRVTLPLFDGVAVEANPPRPLRGLGTFARKINSHEAVSFKLFSLDYTPYVKNEARIECSQPH